MAIDSLQKISSVVPPLLNNSTKASEGVAEKFSDFLSEALNKVNNLQSESEQITNDFATGKTDNIHQVLIAGEKADIALQMAMQVRTKILDAYNEIMRIQF